MQNPYSCINCAYCKITPDSDLLECRRRAPKRPPDDDGGALQRRWPLVCETDWCGEFHHASIPLPNEAPQQYASIPLPNEAPQQ